MRGLKFLVVGILAAVVFGFAVMFLWNWLMPVLFGLKLITYWQAVGLIVLSKLLFGGIHSHGGGRRGRGWKRGMRERFAQMTPEERARFEAGMRGRGRWCRPRGEHPGEPAREQSAV
jgi:hypothetical protein